MLSVGFAGTFAARLEGPVRTRLRIPCDVVVGDEVGILSKLSDLDILVALAFTREMAARAQRLKLVQVPGAGLDRIDRSALRPGTQLANAYGHETGIAEYVIGAMLALTRNLFHLDSALREGIWKSQWAIDSSPPPPWLEMTRKKLGVLGYGRIGQAVARRALAFDMEVCAIRRDTRRPADDGVVLLGGLEALDELLRGSDYVLIALPATPQTRGLIGDAQLGMMKPTSVLINVSRAEIVEEDALYRALAGGIIAAAALDVWYRYPSQSGPTLPARQPFHTLRNVLMTPHVSGWTDGMLDARAALIAENIHRTARGELPLNLVACGG